jgi:hypothetical protein
VERSSSWEADCTSLLLLLICTAITACTMGGRYSRAVCSLGHGAKIVPKWDAKKIIGVQYETQFTEQFLICMSVGQHSVAGLWLGEVIMSAAIRCACTRSSYG